MGNLTTALIIVLSINAMFIMANISIANINPDGPVPYTCNGTLIGEMDANGCAGGGFVLKDIDPQTGLPSGESSVSAETGNIFTDAFTAAKSWLLDTLGLKYLINLLSAPKQVMLSIGLPSEIASVFGGLWWLFTFFLIVGFLLWGDR